MIGDVSLLRRAETRVSNWVRLVEKEVRFGNQPSELYHCLAQADYVVALAEDDRGLIPLVRQYRPAVEAYTWELPAGLIDGGESAEVACRRELQEETGLEVEAISPLGVCYADTGRLENLIHAFLVKGRGPAASFVAEPGLHVDFVTRAALKQRILAGEFRQQMHLGVLAMAAFAGFDLDGN